MVEEGADEEVEVMLVAEVVRAGRGKPFGAEEELSDPFCCSSDVCSDDDAVCSDDVVGVVVVMGRFWSDEVVDLARSSTEPCKKDNHIITHPPLDALCCSAKFSESSLLWMKWRDADSSKLCSKT